MSRQFFLVFLAVVSSSSFLVAQDAGLDRTDDDLANKLLDALQMIPAFHTDLTNYLQPRLGMTLSIEEAERTGHNFEYCDGTLVTVDLRQLVQDQGPCPDDVLSDKLILSQLDWQLFDPSLQRIGSVIGYASDSQQVFVQIDPQLLSNFNISPQGKFAIFSIDDVVRLGASANALEFSLRDTGWSDDLNWGDVSPSSLACPAGTNAGAFWSGQFSGDETTNRCVFNSMRN